MRTLLGAGLAICSIVSLLGCGDDDRLQLQLATYNAGLARGFVDHAEERAPVVMTALASLDVDLLCVQEVWDDADVAALASATAERLPRQVARAPEPAVPDGSEPACPPADADPLEACVRASCQDVPVDDLTDCVFEFCTDEFNATSPACQSCLASNIGKSIDEILTACGSGPGGGYAYGGSFGIRLMTSGEITRQDSLLFESTFNRRAVLYAEVQFPDVAPLHVFCTHLTAVFDTIPYPRDDGSWEAEQAAQIDEMVAYIEAQRGEGVAVLLGDLNTGPAAGASVVAEVPDNYDRLVAAGFANAYLAAPEPPCTFCAANPLVGGGDSVIIDHIMTLGASVEVAAPRRILDEPIGLMVDGSELTTNYSDHYGVAVDLIAPIGR